VNGAIYWSVYSRDLQPLLGPCSHLRKHSYPRGWWAETQFCHTASSIFLRFVENVVVVGKWGWADIPLVHPAATCRGYSPASALFPEQ
jgi:hypothetical protein